MTSKTASTAPKTLAETKAATALLDARAYVARFPGTSNLAEFGAFVRAILDPETATALGLDPKTIDDAIRVGTALVGTYSRYQDGKRAGYLAEFVAAGTPKTAPKRAPRPTAPKTAPKVAPVADAPASE